MNRRHRAALAFALVPIPFAASCSPPQVAAPRAREAVSAVGPTDEATTTEPATTTTVAATTTTTIIPEPVAPSTTPPSTATASRPPVVGSGACGGDLPPCSVMRRESGGDPTAISPYGLCDGFDTRCYGKWQFDATTWWGLGYTGLPSDASEATQDEAARTLWAGGAGCSHWAAC